MKSRSLFSFLLLFVFAVALPALAAPKTFDVDAAHSHVGFSVKHMMISEVSGHFKEFSGKFTFDPDKAAVTDADFTAQTASIDTDNSKRDDHLRSADFFDATKFPTLSLKKSVIKKDGKDKFKWTADLTMHGVTKPVVFELEYNGMIKDPMGNNRAAFTANGKISRKDFGLTWNKAMESGGVVVGDEVKVQITAEAVEVKKDDAKKVEKAEKK